MYTYMNISHFEGEESFLLNFAQTNEFKKEGNLKKKLQTRVRTEENKIKRHAPYFNLASNVTFFLNFTSNKLFNLLDSNSDGFVDWYDFGNFFQISFLFAKFDPQLKGKLTAGELYQNYNEFSDYPRISSVLRNRARRFNVLNADSFIDVFQALVVLRIDDIVNLYLRNADKSTLYEVELKRIFVKTSLRHLNEGILNSCLRGLDSHNIPKYDWECAFMAGVQENINYLESAASYNTAKENNLHLHNTVFYNVDPALAGSKPKKFL